MSSLLNREKVQQMEQLVDSLSRPQQTLSIPSTNISIDNIVQHILLNAKRCNVSVDRVFKGGSSKKNTSLKHDFDIDLVVFINCASVQFFLDQKSASLAAIAFILKEKEGVKESSQTDKVFSFTFQQVHFDILVGYNALQGHPASADTQREILHKELNGREERVWKEMSSSLTESSFEFLKKRAQEDEAVIRAIKLAKFWNKLHFKGSHAYKLRSYAFEVLLCFVYHHRKGKGLHEAAIGEGAPALFVDLLQLFAKLPEQRPIIRFGEFIDSTKYKPYHTDEQHPLIVVDPTNPFINLVDDFRNWRALYERAITDLQNIANPNFNIASVFPDYQKFL